MGQHLPMAFPPPKQGGIKGWAGGAPPGGAAPPGHPAPPPAGAPGAPPAGGQPGAPNPQMVQRAMKAITQMLQDGGLPQPAMDCMQQCMQHLQGGAAPPGAPPPPGGAAPPSPHPAAPPGAPPPAPGQ